MTAQWQDVEAAYETLCDIVDRDRLDAAYRRYLEAIDEAKRRWPDVSATSDEARRVLPHLIAPLPRSHFEQAR
jgi:hypothetical protein